MQGRDLGEISSGYMYSMTLELLEKKDKRPYLVSSQKIFKDLTRFSNAFGCQAEAGAIVHAMLPNSRIERYRYWFCVALLNGGDIEEIVEDESDDDTLAEIRGNRFVKRSVWATYDWLKEHKAAPGDDVIISARIPSMANWFNELSSKLYGKILGRLNYEF